MMITFQVKTVIVRVTFWRLNASSNIYTDEALLGVASLPKRICYNPQNDDSIPGHYLEGKNPVSIYLCFL
jgi:hypothetical protein